MTQSIKLSPFVCFATDVPKNQWCAGDDDTPGTIEELFDPNYLALMSQAHGTVVKLSFKTEKLEGDYVVFGANNRSRSVLAHVQPIRGFRPELRLTAISPVFLESRFNAFGQEPVGLTYDGVTVLQVGKNNVLIDTATQAISTLAFLCDAVAVSAGFEAAGNGERDRKIQLLSGWNWDPNSTPARIKTLLVGARGEFRVAR